MNHLTVSWANLQVQANEIRDHLLLRGTFHDKAEDEKFTGRDDLIAHYGKPYLWTPEQHDVERGEMGLCFQNALHAALDNGWVYVEGYAAVHGVPLHHAWCSDDGRTAIDATWDKGTDYFGVPLDPHFVSARVQRRGYYGFFADMPDATERRWYKNGLPPEALA